MFLYGASSAMEHCRVDTYFVQGPSSQKICWQFFFLQRARQQYDTVSLGEGPEEATKEKEEREKEFFFGICQSHPECKDEGRALTGLRARPLHTATSLPENLSSVNLRLMIPVAEDTLAERLRRRPAKPMGSPRVGSNPTGVVCCAASALFREF